MQSSWQTLSIGPYFLTAEQFLRSLQVAAGNQVDLGHRLLVPLQQTFPEIVADVPVTTLKQTMMLSNHEGLHQYVANADLPMVKELMEMEDWPSRVKRASRG